MGVVVALAFQRFTNTPRRHTTTRIHDPINERNHQHCANTRSISGSTRYWTSCSSVWKQEEHWNGSKVHLTFLDLSYGFVDLLGHEYSWWYVVLVFHLIFGERALLLLGRLCYCRCNRYENKIAWVASGLVMLWHGVCFCFGRHLGRSGFQGDKKVHPMYHYYGQKHQNGFSSLYKWSGI